MSKGKSKPRSAAVNRSSMYLTVFTNMHFLHSPCVTESCTVDYQHCSGCNESYPCKSRQILDGRTVAQINKQIELMQQETVTVFGDQAEDADTE